MSEETYYNSEGVSPNTSGQEQKTVVYGYREGPFRAMEDLLEIVANPDLDRVSNQPPFRPKACEIYVYECEQRYMDKRLWIYDGYRWRNNGKHKYPKPNPLFEKIYFNMENPAEPGIMAFRRCAYIPLNKDLKYMVVQYLGNECFSSTTISSTLEPNRAGFQLTPIRADPIPKDCGDISLLGSNCSLTAFLSEDSRIAGQNLIRSVHHVSSGHPSQPSTSGSRKRSLALVSKEIVILNKCSSVRKGADTDTDVWVDENGESIFRFSKKTFSDLMTQCFEMRLNKFFWSFNSAPDLILVFGSCELLADLKDLLLSNDNQVQFLTYNTSPCLDGFFVSILSVVHPKFISLELNNNPAVIPLAFMIHQNKNSFSHSALFSIIKEHLSVQGENKDTNLAIVSDRDTDIINSLKKTFPNCINLLSLTHIKKEAQCWLTKNMHSKRGDRYMTDLEDMMKAMSKSEFDSLLQSHKDNCSRSWLNFFEASLQEDLVSHSNNWMLIKDKLVHQEVLEQHQSIALEQVLDDLELCHDATMDKLVQALYLLQKFFIKELQKGRCGSGTFRLTQKYTSESIDPQTVNLDESAVVPPYEIVKSVMDKMADSPDTMASGIADQGEKIHIKREPGFEEEDSNIMMLVTKNFSDVDEDVETDKGGENSDGEEQGSRKHPSNSPNRNSTGRKYQRTC